MDYSRLLTEDEKRANNYNRMKERYKNNPEKMKEYRKKRRQKNWNKELEAKKHKFVAWMVVDTPYWPKVIESVKGNNHIFLEWNKLISKNKISLTIDDLLIPNL